MADYLAHKIAGEIYQWLHDEWPPTQVALGAKIAEIVNDYRGKQPNELRPRGDHPCFLRHTDIPKGEHRWCSALEPEIKVQRCICGAVLIDKDAYPG